MYGKHFTCPQPIKFLLVGILNTIVGALVMFALYNLAHCSYWLSSACNYVIGGICSFFLNKRFTFQNDEKSFAQFALFVLVVALCYFVAYFCAKNLVRLLLREVDAAKADNIALLCGMCLYTILNFFGQKYLVFAVQKEQK